MKHIILAHEVCLFQVRLGQNQTIKGIFMVERKLIEIEDMGQRNRQQLNPIALLGDKKMFQ